MPKHIAPQHPDDEFGDKSKFNWDEEKHPQKATLRDSLGNMVMISSGQNSALSNSCFEVKRARMERYASGTGNVESLKMLYVYSQYESWSINNIVEHQQCSMSFLQRTYEKDVTK